MSFKYSVLKTSLSAITRQRYRQFLRAIENPRAAQKQVLSQCLSLSLKQQLPESPTNFTNYPSGASWSQERVKYFEPTSGSSGLGQKKVPYTSSLLHSFQSMFSIWAHDIIKNGPQLKSGNIFLSISPNQHGFGTNEETDYLKGLTQKLINPFVVRPQTGTTSTLSDHFSAVAKSVAEEESLEIISVWSPTYFIALQESILLHRQNIALSSERDQFLRTQDWQSFWPHLKLISSWGSGTSLGAYEHLKRKFPSVYFQKKGLLSTEAPVTVPFVGLETGSLPLWLDVYLEYIDEQNSIRPLSDIDKGESGSILVTSKGGLLRYELGDKVQCTGFYKGTPLIEFLGRQTEISDLVGEKLEGSWLREHFPKTQGNWSLLPIFLIEKPYYMLLADHQWDVNPEGTLKENYHYNLARSQNQLGTLRTKLIPNLSAIQSSFFQEKGLRLGDIKDCNLWADSGLAQDFLQYLSAKKYILPSDLQ